MVQDKDGTIHAIYDMFTEGRAVFDLPALPFAEGSLDLIALPHTLELCGDPHAALREAHRALMHEGRLVITGLVPWRAHLWQRLHGGGPLYLPPGHEFIAPQRLRDSLIGRASCRERV